MEKSVKKEIFLKILKLLFNDDTRAIKENNCIRFYHFLVNTLNCETESIPEEDISDITMCLSITWLLCNFDQLDSSVECWNFNLIKSYLKKCSSLNDIEFEYSLYKFRNFYTLIKDDFLLGLS